MGEHLISIYKNKCKKEWKIAFISTFIIGMLVHLYKFTNYLPNHDSLYGVYSAQNGLRSGRWFLSIACGLSSYFDLPWINGLLSVIYISLTAVVVIELLKIENKVAIVLSGGLLVTFPSVSGTFMYEFTADGYMLAMLLSAVAIYIVRMEKITAVRTRCVILRVIISTVLLCLSCGIYQAYISFALVLAVCYFVILIFEGNTKFKIYFKWILSCAISFVAGLSSYYVIWKICMWVQNVSPTDYQGMDQIGSFTSIKDILVSGILNTIKLFGKFIFGYSSDNTGITFYNILAVLFFACLIVLLLFVFFKNKIYKNAVNTLFVCVAVIASPFFVCMWYFASYQASYHILMLQSIVLYYILFIAVSSRYLKPFVSDLSALLAIVVIIYFSIEANIEYFSQSLIYEKSYSNAILLQDEILREQNGDNNRSVVVIGNYKFPEENHGNKSVPMVPRDNNLTGDSEHVRLFFSNYINSDIEFETDENIIAEIAKTEEFSEMSMWPQKDSVETIDDYIVVKLGDPVEE